jgi:tetratricopeptide (TPR) repeat protein
MRSGNIDGAVADYSEAIRLKPNYRFALTRRGLAYERLGQRERALADYRAALAIPQREDNNKWALDTARTRIAALSGGEQASQPGRPAS